MIPRSTVKNYRSLGKMMLILGPAVSWVYVRSSVVERSHLSYQSKCIHIKKNSYYTTHVLPSHGQGIMHSSNIIVNVRSKNATSIVLQASSSKSYCLLCRKRRLHALIISRKNLLFNIYDYLQQKREPCKKFVKYTRVMQHKYTHENNK